MPTAFSRDQEPKLDPLAAPVPWTLLKAMVDASPDLMAVKDPQLRYVAVNAAFMRFAGRTEAEILGRTDPDLFHAAQAAAYQETDRLVLASGETLEHEQEAVGPEGWRWLQVRKAPLRGEQGLVAGVVVTVRDITQRRQAEASLRIQVDRYATLLSTSHDGFWAMDLEGRLLDANEAYARMSGYTREELMTMSIPDLEAVEGPHETARHIARIVEKGFDLFESRHRRKDGSVFEVEVSASFLASTGQFVALFRDITERRRAQLAAQAERQRFNDILDTLPVYLVLLTPDYRIAFANRFFRERFGASVGHRCYEHLFGRDAPCEQCETYRTLETSRALQWEWVGPDGRTYYVYDFPFQDIDGTTLILETGIDITTLKQAEASVRQLNATLERRVADRTAALETANKELEAFSYSISHDLRAPLRAINGFAEVLREDLGAALDENAGAILVRMRDAAARMNELIDGLLTLSRIIRSDLEPRSVDLGRLAQLIVDDLRAAEPQRNVLCEIEPGLTVTGDPSLLNVLLQNLLGNAWKFTARREPGHIVFGRRIERGREVFFVRDNGAGFDQRFAHKLFRPFERLHTNRDYEGTGIGLATVCRVIQRHRGRVWAEGEPGVGATFYFTLGPDANAAAAAEEGVGPAEPRSGALPLE